MPPPFLLFVLLTHAPQETIKLYVIFNVLEIFDKYCAWLGQDILDALFSRKRQTRVFLVAVAYTRMC